MRNSKEGRATHGGPPGSAEAVLSMALPTSRIQPKAGAGAGYDDWTESGCHHCNWSQGVVKSLI